jgi:hypothetical protein
MSRAIWSCGNGVGHGHRIRRVGFEFGGHDDVGGQNQPLGGLVQQPFGFGQGLFFDEGCARFIAAGPQEGVGHAAADEDFIGRLQQLSISLILSEILAPPMMAM